MFATGWKWGLWPSRELLKAGIGFVDLCATAFDEQFVEEKNGKWPGENAGPEVYDRCHASEPISSGGIAVDTS